MILVTGGTGIVGAHILFELVNSGEQVKALQRETSSTTVVKDIFKFYSPKGEELFSKIQWITGDLTDVFSLENAVKECTVVFHAAALVSFVNRDFNLLQDVNGNGTTNLVNVCLSAGISEFYYVSSVAAIGRNEKTKEVNELTEWEPSGQNSGYAVSKYRAEMEVWRGGEEGLKVAMVNPTIVLGPGRTDSSSGTLFRAINDGQSYYTLGENGFVDARDVAFVLKTLFDKKHFGERYVLVGENASYKTIADLMAKYLDKTAPKTLAKPWLTGLVWRVLGFFSFFSRKRPLLTRESADSSQRKTHYINSKVRQELGVTFRTAEQSIKNAAGFFKQFPHHLK